MTEAKPKIAIAEQRILEFIDYLKNSGTIKFKEDFYRETGIIRQYVREVEIGNNRFTSTQITTICETYNVNANWIFGIESDMLRVRRSNVGHKKRHIEKK